MEPRVRARLAGDLSKRVVDVILTSSALIVLAPLLASCAVAVWSTTGTPILYRDRRAGRRGSPFELLKFRTMRGLRPGETIPESDELRITRIGRILRSTSLDELPSLLNVLKGDMSIVGPRPLPLRYVDRYSDFQRRRLEVRPGVTGWAQVNGRNSITWDEKFALDVWYVDHRTLRLDVEIIVDTVRQVLKREGVSHEGHATMPEFTGRADPETPS